MALKLGKMFGKDKAKADEVELDMPTTQVKMSEAQPPGYDPLASVSIMEQLRTATATTAMPRKLWFIGGLPVVKQFQSLGVMMFTFLVFAAILVFLDGRQAEQNAAGASTATEMQMLSQRLARSSALAADGVASALPVVRDSRARFVADLDAMLKGGTVRGVSLEVAQEDATVELLNAVKDRWTRADAAAERLLGNEAALTAIGKGLEGIAANRKAVGDLAQQVAQLVAQSGATPRDVQFARDLPALAQRIAKTAGAVAASAEAEKELLPPLVEDVATFRETVNGLLKGGDPLRLTPVRGEDARTALTELQKRFAPFEATTEALTQNQARLVVAKQAARAVGAEAEPLLADTTKLAAIYEGSSARVYTLGIAIFFALMALLMLVLIGKVFLDDARVRTFESEGENKRNQEAILRLLNEMGNLADGDLTVQASVTEDVTGAIADSINFTIEELRTLVRGINSATDQVTKATQETQAISNRLFEASQRQNREIQQASASVLQMAQSINEVSQTATQSARVAQRSLAAAEKGGEVVQSQIAGMNEIRAQIQDTSKRIKRLGESSMEIGEIVELISDITEQTNVLALNAAIQAASAGEAGRGFTVVAEEVQRLAERSGEATKQIDAIVKTIQADTQDAVAAMEKSTVGVVEGTKLSDAAGQALSEIQTVSRDLAELIGRISAQTSMQSTSVTDVTRGMQGILKITEETTEGTKQTNVSIGQLTKLAADLRSSVAGFKV